MKETKIRIKNNIPNLLKETGAKPVDLMRAGLAQGTAYKVARGETSGMDFSTMEILIQFFDERIKRPITVEDLLKIEVIPGVK